MRLITCSHEAPFLCCCFLLCDLSFCTVAPQWGYGSCSSMAHSHDQVAALAALNCTAWQPSGTMVEVENSQEHAHSTHVSNSRGVGTPTRWVHHPITGKAKGPDWERGTCSSHQLISENTFLSVRAVRQPVRELQQDQLWEREREPRLGSCHLACSGRQKGRAPFF